MRRRAPARHGPLLTRGGGKRRSSIRDDEDWEGNNAAFTCPVCKKFFIVSALLHQGRRTCPNAKCGKISGLGQGRNTIGWRRGDRLGRRPDIGSTQSLSPIRHQRFILAERRAASPGQHGILLRAQPWIRSLGRERYSEFGSLRFFCLNIKPW